MSATCVTFITYAVAAGRGAAHAGAGRRSDREMQPPFWREMELWLLSPTCCLYRGNCDRSQDRYGLCRLRCSPAPTRRSNEVCHFRSWHQTDMTHHSRYVCYRGNSGLYLLGASISSFGPQQMRWMAPAHGIWVPKCEGHQVFTSKMGAIRYGDYHDRPRLGQERFSDPRR
jgi:hypothetical protein